MRRASAPCPTSASTAARREPLKRLQLHLASDRASRARRRRERGSARNAARAAARPRHRAAERGLAGRIRVAATERYAIVVAPLAEGFAAGPSRPSSSSPRPSSSPRRRPRAAGASSRSRSREVEALIRDLSELKVGDPVVHVNHGIGRYVGLINIDLGDGPRRVPAPRVRREGDALRAGGAAAPDRPLHRRQRRGRAAAPLGSGQWEKAKRKAAEQVRDTRGRAARTSTRGAPRARAMRSASSRTTTRPSPTSFGFEETPDQHAAIHAVIQDMISPQPMDRLVCGDVGFGKTEVALRAAFVAVTGGKQVAMLAPTTLLAEQHFQNIADRFGKWPVKVAEMSRFRSAQGDQGALEGLEDGTHRHRRRHAQAAQPEHEVQAPRPARSSTRSTASACATRRR